jgi:hypothetical protein
VESFPTSDCTVTDPSDPTQVNRCTARIVGFHWVYLMRPYYNGSSPPNVSGEFYTDFQNQGGGQTVQTIAAVVINFTPDVTVEGRCFSEFTAGAPKAVRLIAG